MVKSPSPGTSIVIVPNLALFLSYILSIASIAVFFLSVRPDFFIAFWSFKGIGSGFSSDACSLAFSISASRYFFCSFNVNVSASFAGISTLTVLSSISGSGSGSGSVLILGSGSTLGFSSVLVLVLVSSTHFLYSSSISSNKSYMLRLLLLFIHHFAEVLLNTFVFRNSTKLSYSKFSISNASASSSVFSFEVPNILPIASDRIFSAHLICFGLPSVISANSISSLAF